MKNFKKPTLLLVLSLLWLPGFTQKMNYSYLLIPQELKEDANEVIRLNYTKLVVDSKKEATLHIKYVVTILNSKSHKGEQIVSYSQNKRINSLNASVYDSIGNVVEKFNKNDFSDHSAIDRSTIYSDARFKYIELSHNTYPYTIEIEYKLAFKDILYYPTWNIQGFNSSVENLIYIVETLPELDIRYKARNIDIEPEIDQSGKRAIYKWTVTNRPAIKAEEFMPSYDQILPHIEVTPRHFQYDQYVGDASTWQSFGKFFHDLRKGREALSPEMIGTVKKLTSGLNSDQGKIEVLYRYLQENTRYVSVQLGIGGYQPFAAKYVEKNKYGDCKALSNFMLSMLKQANITAQPGIIYRDDETRTIVDEDFPTMFGNHMILYVPSEDIWLECTSNHYPVNYLGSSNDNRSVLLLSEEGGTLKTSPAFKLSDNTQSSTINIKIDIEGSASIQATVNTKGPKHELYRYIENEISSEGFEKYFLRTSDLPAFSIESLEVRSKKESPEAQLDFDIVVNRYATKAGKRFFIPINRLNTFEEVPSPTEKRIHPIEVLRGYQETDNASFEFPEGYEVESIPNKEINLETKYGKYIVKIKVRESVVNYHRLLEIKAVKLAPEEFESFREFYKEIAKWDNMKIVLVKKKT